ncbi:DUF192 domain-containing protein [Candidatus Nomurabacteria bacterium]|nr:DUF192 domain-containing protein [Candidatus Nomurabacteria bacterium]
MKKYLIILVAALVLFFLLFYFPNNSKTIKSVRIAGQNIKVELAVTAEEKQKGLSGRNNLKEDKGMLFVFENLDNYSFWMKDMNFPIDMIWIGEDLKVIYIKKNALPESYPESFGPEISDKNVKYVLEVVSGFSDKNNLKIGDSVLFTY